LYERLRALDKPDLLVGCAINICAGMLTEVLEDQVAIATEHRKALDRIDPAGNILDDGNKIFNFRTIGTEIR
jgi:hypothetical protein